MGRDALLHRVDLRASTRRIFQRALQRVPGLHTTEGQPCRIEAAAARARENIADLDAVRAERLADPPCLRAPAVVEVALGGAVIQACVRGIEATGREAVAQHDHRAWRTQR